MQCWQLDRPYRAGPSRYPPRSASTGGKVANLRISPDCEWFSASTRPAPSASGAFKRIRHAAAVCAAAVPARRGADLCFVETSLPPRWGASASAGGSGGGAASNLCLWDVLLPPAQAQVARWPLPSDARAAWCCAADQSLVVAASARWHLRLAPAKTARDVDCAHPHRLRYHIGWGTSSFGLRGQRHQAVGLGRSAGPAAHPEHRRRVRRRPAAWQVGAGDESQTLLAAGGQRQAGAEGRHRADRHARGQRRDEPLRG